MACLFIPCLARFGSSSVPDWVFDDRRVRRLREPPGLPMDGREGIGAFDGVHCPSDPRQTLLTRVKFQKMRDA
jgi:hypothetical protein